jgi:hypothetical protein
VLAQRTNVKQSSEYCLDCRFPFVDYFNVVVKRFKILLRNQKSISESALQTVNKRNVKFISVCLPKKTMERDVRLPEKNKEMVIDCYCFNMCTHLCCFLFF